MLPRDAKQDTRPRRGRWAPGNYLNSCVMCDTWFIGEKRAGQCADCAYGPELPINTPTPNG